jgi:hypothetical protein
MEFFEIHGERVPVPSEVVSAGREAVAAWAEAETRKRSARPVTAPPGEE